MKLNYTGFPLAEIYFNAMRNKGHTDGSADYYARQQNGLGTNFRK